MVKNAVTICVISLAVGAAQLLQAQTQRDVFVLPGANSTQQTVTVFSADPFSNIGGVSAGPGTFLVVAKPDGSKFYAIANSGSSTVTVIPNSFTNPRSIANLGAQATAAAITEDGKRLGVAAGLFHVFDTTSDTDIVPNGISLGPGYTAFDVAGSLDGKTFFVLGSNTAGGSVLAAVDASSSVVTSTIPITGPTIGVAVGPNALVYVSAPNQILEINPNTFAATSGGPILLNARPGKLSFTPDGQYALAVNQTPVTGSAMVLIGIASHAIVNSVPNFQVTLDQLYVLNSTTFLATSSQNQSLYQITLSSNGNLSINGFPFPGVGSSTNVNGIALSNEVPLGGRTTPQYLYAVINGTLYREDLTTSSQSGSFPLAATAGGLSFAGAATTGPLPATLLQYGNNQTVAANGVSLPIVVRVLDNVGNPLSGVNVTFGTNNSSASVSPSTVTTLASGYAITYLTAPSTPGPMTVTATAGAQTVGYTISVGTGSGGGTNAGALKIVAGQGQMIRESSSTNAGAGTPLKVLVTDPKNNPAANVAVTFAVTQGNGGGISSSGMNGNSIVVNTDSTGTASVDFLATILPLGTDFTQTTVTASTPGTNSVNFYVTTVPLATAADPTVRLLKPDQGAVLSGQAGSTIPDAVEVAVISGHGQAIPNVGIVIPIADSTLPGASCNDPNGTGVLTQGANGIAVCDLVLNGKVGSANLTVSVGYFTTTPNFTLRITNGPPGVVKILQGNNQSGLPGQRLPLALLVQVTDAFGNILSGVPVSWSVVTPGSVTLSQVFTATDPNGNASALATLGNIAGNAQVKVTAGSVSATFTLTVNIPSTGIQKVSGDNQTTLVNTSFPAQVVVKVVDANGNGVAGVQVTFSVTGSGNVVTPTVTTGSNGQAATTVNAGATPGTITVTATSSSFSTTFTLTSRLPGPSNVTFTNAASFLGTISPGSIILINGTGIAPGVQGLVTAYNILGAPQPSLAGISITFNGVTAPIYYVQTAAGKPDQVAVQVPFETQPGTANVVINSAGGGSGTFTVQVVAYAPGIFETVSGGQKYAVALRPDGSYVSPNNPAHPGEIIRIYLTGLGQVTPATATGDAGVPGQSVAATLIVGVNNAGVPFLAAEYAPGLVGVYVITVQLPPDTQTGSAQPIGVIAYDAAGNAYFAQGSVIAIQ